MEYSIITTTNRQVSQIIPFLKSISSQTILPKTVFLVCDHNFIKNQFKIYKSELKTLITSTFFSKIQFITNINDDFISGKGVSFNRNYAIKKTKTYLSFFIDDDNIIPKNLLEKLINIFKEYSNKYKLEPILVPSEYIKGKLQPRGYTRFLYCFGVQKPLFLKFKQKKILKIANQKIYPIQFSSSNCFFGSTKIFKEILFDERMKFIYEDFDITKRITKGGNQIFSVLDLEVDHKMREKTELEKSYIEDSAGLGIYEKSKNRIIFVKNTSNFVQKICYFCIGIRIHSFFLIYKILKYADKNKQKILLQKLYKGTIQGIKFSKLKK